MESRIEKYLNVQAEITRLTNILMAQHWLPLDQAREEAVKIEARTRRQRALSQIDNDWYSWVRDVHHLPQVQQEGSSREVLAWF
jgi:hypothetical protein